jgi:hypothetical protein
MTTVQITRGCNGQPAEQFIEGITTYARICKAESAQLQIFNEAPCLVVVLVDGEETFRSQIPGNVNKEFSLTQILCPKHGLEAMREGLRSIFHLGNQAQKEGQGLNIPRNFTVEIRKGPYPGTLDGTFHMELLTNEEFDMRFHGFIVAHKPEEPKPVFTRDARPVEIVIAAQTKCPVCGNEIGNASGECENPTCPNLAGPPAN